MHSINCLQLYISLSWCITVIEVYIFINIGRGKHFLLIVHTFVVPGCLSWVLEQSLNCFGKSSGMLDNEVHCLSLISLEHFRVEFPVRFLDFVVREAGLRDKTKPGHLVWASFYVKWTVEKCSEETVFSIDPLSVITREVNLFWCLVLWELRCPKVKHKCMQLCCSLNTIILVPAGRKRTGNRTCTPTMRTYSKRATICLYDMNICILSVWQVQVHTVLESDVLSDCLARQHLHNSAPSHPGNSSPLPSLEDFTGMSG